MKRILYIIIALLSSTNVIMGMTIQNDTIIYEDEFDERFADWTDEQYESYEDSVFAELYHPVVEEKADSSILGENMAKDSVFKKPPLFMPNDFVPKSVTLDMNKEVGEIHIKSGTTPTGARMYEIPIDVYPGVKGFQPHLALVYNSQQGNSLYGMGWSLSGLSMISRGGKSIYYDTKPQGVVMNNSDSFVLDGVRLIKTGTSAGCILYESEQGNIKAKGYVSESIMKYFEVFYPDGNKGVYGYKSGASNYLYYPLTSLTDMNGNTMTCTYSFPSNHFNISTISYNGVSIVFKYSNRQDPLLSYCGGRRIYEPQLLQSIVCKLGTTVLGTYTLNYTTQNSVSLLTKVEYTASGKSYNPIYFYYGSGNDAISYRKSTIQLLDWYKASDPNMIKVVKGRFDYDNGADGLISLPNLNPYWKHHRNSSTFRHSQNRFDNRFTGGEKIFLYAGLKGERVSPMPNLLTETGFVDIVCADLEGCQEENIIKINNTVVNDKDCVTFNVYRSNIHTGLLKLYTRTYSFSTVYTDADKAKSIQPKFYYTGDFNGDGRMEVLAVSANQPFNDTSKPSQCYIFDLLNDKILYQNHVMPYDVEFVGTQQTDPKAAANKTDRLFVMDYDGDGKTDICHIDESGTNIYTFDVSGNTLSARKVATYTDLKKSDLANREVLTGEFNGDGLMDLLVSPSNETNGGTVWAVYNSKGDGLFDKSTFNGTRNFADNRGFIIQDINGDGKTDLLKYDAVGFYTFLAKNNSVGNTTSYTSFSSRESILIPTNMNTRNCFTQLLSLYEGVVTKYSFPRDDNMESMATGMVSSLGVIEKNEYRLLNEEIEGWVLYEKGHFAVYPYVNINEPLPVIASSETYLDGNRIDYNDFRYQNAVIHRQGLGFCGFGKISTFNKKGQKLEQTYEPYRYCLLKSEISPTYEKSYTYTVSKQSNNIAKVRLTKKVEKDLLKNVSATTSYVYDLYGYPTTETTSYTGNITVKKENEYSSNAKIGDGYNLGFLTNQLVTVTRNGLSYTERMYIPDFSLRLPGKKIYYKNGSQIRQQVYVYDSNGNLTSETIQPYTSLVTQKTLYVYDSYGRLSKVTNPMGLTNEFTYDAYGRVVGKKDHRGKTTTYSYDAFGRKTTVSYPDNTKKEVRYGWSSAATNGLYSITRMNTGKPTMTEVYDALNREVRRSETLFDGSVKNVDKLYDLYGNLQKESLPFIGNTASLWNMYSYDIYDRILSCTEASGKKTTYGYSGNSVTTVLDNVSTTRCYDVQGHLISVSDSSGTVTYNLGADGLPFSIEAPGNVTTYISYDGYRRQIKLTDPSSGTISYEYDNAGNISKEIMENGEIIRNEYDSYNRLVRKTTPEFVTSYNYNDKDELTEISTDNGTSKSFIYDVYGRLTTYKENIVDGKWLQKDFSYAGGNVSSVRYTSQSGVLATENYIYSNGHLSETNLNGTTTVFKLTNVNAFGQPTEIVTGGIKRKYDFTAYGLPSGRSGSGTSDALQNFYYVFDDATSCLKSRKDMTRNIMENFGYDNLNRLTSYTDETAEYDNKGNIISKSDIGTFEYALHQKPYAVSGMTLSGSGVPLVCGQDIVYASFRRPVSICDDNYTATFTYNSDYDRVKMCLSQDGSNVLNRYYLGNCYELDQTSSSSKEKLYLFGDYYAAAAVYVKEASSPGVYYILRDYLGSITHIVASDGTLVQELSYDAWGRLRNPATQEVFLPGQEPELFLGRGYTGHEHITQFGLINMNARLYDPALGRFLSPDPYVQEPDMSQNFNRYTYALNNPLKYNDPNGEFFLFTIFNAFTDLVWNVFSRGVNFSHYNWNRTVNSWKIDMGMFRGNIGQILNKWTWGLLNSVVGNLVSEGYNTVGYVDNVTSLDGMLALSGATSGERAFTIGHYSFGPNGYEADWRDHLFVHEYGHYIQSQQWGYFYIPVIAVPSLISASGIFGGDHSYKWFEVNASKLGAYHFDKKYGRGADGYVEGDENYFDIASFSGKKGKSPYENPRRGDFNIKKYPITGSRSSFSDYLIPAVSMGLPLLFIF